MFGNIDKVGQCFVSDVLGSWLSDICFGGCSLKSRTLCPDNRPPTQVSDTRIYIQGGWVLHHF